MLCNGPVAARRVLDAFNSDDWPALSELLSADHKYEEHGTQRLIEGAHDVVDTMKAWKQAMPDVVGRPSNFFQSGDSVAVELVWSGTHTGPLQTPDGVIPASGRSQRTPGCWVLDFEDGEAVSSRNYFDMLSFLQQIGAA